jgi:hypothetical protein
LDNRRRSALKEALQENQPNIEELAAHLQEAMRTAALNLRHDYEERSLGLARELTASRDEPFPVRRELVTDLVALNEIYLKRLDTLKALHESYRTLPTAHREIIQSLSRPLPKLPAINELHALGRHLFHLYRELVALMGGGQTLGETGTELGYTP